MRTTARFFVYHCYDAAGRVLYVGHTINPRRRMAEHLRPASARPEDVYLREHMARWDIDPVTYSTKWAAIEAERHAIYRDQPLLNKAHNGVQRHADNAYQVRRAAS